MPTRSAGPLGDRSTLASDLLGSAGPCDDFLVLDQCQQPSLRQPRNEKPASDGSRSRVSRDKRLPSRSSSQPAPTSQVSDVTDFFFSEIVVQPRTTTFAPEQTGSYRPPTWMAPSQPVCGCVFPSGKGGDHDQPAFADSASGQASEGRFEPGAQTLSGSQRFCEGTHGAPSPVSSASHGCGDRSTPQGRSAPARAGPTQRPPAARCWNRSRVGRPWQGSRRREVDPAPAADPVGGLSPTISASKEPLPSRIRASPRLRPARAPGPCWGKGPQPLSGPGAAASTLGCAIAVARSPSSGARSTPSRRSRSRRRPGRTRCARLRRPCRVSRRRTPAARSKNQSHPRRAKILAKPSRRRPRANLRSNAASRRKH